MATSSRRDVDRTRQFEKRAKRRVIRQLHSAVTNNDIKQVQDMLTPDLDVNFHYNGESALQIAVVHGFEELCEILINNGADVNKYNAEENTLLNMVAWRGFTNIVKLLIRHGAELDVVNNHGATAVNSAAYRGHTDVVQALVEADCDLNRANHRGQTPLLSAARENRLDVAQVLINGGCLVNRPDNERRTPLVVAAERGHVNLVKLLVASGSDLNLTDQYRCSALYLAAKAGHTDVVRELTIAGANLDLANTKGCTPFLEATRGQYVNVLEVLADAGANVNTAEYETKQAPIHAAVRTACQYFGSSDSHLSLVKLLVNSGCDLNVADRQGWTPLHQSAFGGDVDIVKLLLDTNASIDVMTETGDSPLHGAVFGNKPEVIEMLIKAGADVNAANNRNELPLYTAIDLRANMQIIRQLVDAGSEVDVCEKTHHQSPLFAAVVHDCAETVRFLISAGCDVNQTNSDGTSPLCAACDKGSDEMIQLLLSQPGIDVNQGVVNFPLHAAARHGYVSVAKVLLQAGSEVNQLTMQWESALRLAVSADNVSLVRLLIYWGANPSTHHGIPRGRCCMTYTDSHPHLELEPLYTAVQKDNFLLIKEILEATPRMPYQQLRTLKDIMFRTRYAADAGLQPRLLIQYAEFFLGILSRPRNLLTECRGIIRTCIGRKPFDKVKQLPLPSKLQEFIAMEGILQ